MNEFHLKCAMSFYNKLEEDDWADCNQAICYNLEWHISNVIKM